MRLGIDTLPEFALIASMGLACSAAVRVYDGAPRDADEVATLLSSHPESDAEVSARAIDGDAVEGSRWELLPGHHVVSAHVYDQHQTTGELTIFEGGCELSFVARAGASYRLQGSHDGDCRAWLVDRATGEEHARCGCRTARHTSVRGRNEEIGDGQPIQMPLPFPWPSR